MRSSVGLFGRHPASTVLLVCATVASAWGANINVRVAGSTSVAPIVSKASELFNKRYPHINILVTPSGSGAGVQAIGEKTADIGMISRAVSPEERRRYPQTTLVVTPIARDAVVPVVSAAVYQAGVTVLSIEDLRNIYSGKVTNWRLLGGPDREILVIDKEASRGTRHVFMKAVFGDENAIAKGAKLVTGSNNEEQSAVAQSDAAIGLLSHAWMNRQVKGLAIRSDGRVIEPTLDNLTRGVYPMVRDLSLVTDGHPTGAVATFMQFLLGPEGQGVVKELSYVPVR